MSNKENRDLVLNFYRLMSELQFDAMFELMADDGTWTIAGDPNLFHHSGSATKQQRREALGHFTKAFASLDMEVRSITAEEDRVAVELITRCETRGGLKYENELLVLIRCRNGRIVSLYEHLDQATSLEFERRMAAAS